MAAKGDEVAYDVSNYSENKVFEIIYLLQKKIDILKEQHLSLRVIVSSEDLSRPNRV